jgi:outer membrane receptor protein involved in Fe transport
LLGNGDIFNETKQYYGSLELNYRPASDITVTSLTGYYHLLFRGQQSASTSTYAGPSLMSVVDPIRRRDFTEELRVASDFSGPLNFVAGGFLQRSNLFFHSSLPGNTVIGAPAMLSNFEDQVRIQTNSLFGQVRWKPVSSVEISAGARWTDESRELTAWNLLSGSPVIVPTARPKITSSNVAPEVTVTYHPITDVTLFASYKKGYKSGSFNLAPITAVLPDQSFGDEKAEGWEGGIKAQSADHSLFASLAVYDYRYKGLQVGVSAPSTTNGPPINRTLNAGAAKIYGVDLDLNYAPRAVTGLTFHGSLEWNHARYTDLTGVPCYGGQMISEGCNGTLNPVTGLYTTQTLSGLPLLRAPTWQTSFGFDYEMPVGHAMKLGFASNSQVSSRYLANLGLRPDFFQPGYFKTDFTVSLKGADDRWVLDLIGKNLTDKLTSSGCVNSNVQGGVIFGGEVTGGTTRGPAGVDELSCYMDRGREVWIRLTLRPFN